MGMGYSDQWKSGLKQRQYSYSDTPATDKWDSGDCLVATNS